MKLFLGIDSGGTKTKFLLVDENGRRIAESIQAASHYLQVGYDGLKQVMTLGLTDCLNQCNYSKEDIHFAFASVAGYGDIEDDNESIYAVIKDVLSPININIGNDVENAFAGGLIDQPGIVLIAGTGSIGLGIDESNQMIRCGGWHHIYGGDEGSAYWIGCKLIQEFTLQSDGRSAHTKLYTYMKNKYQFKNDSDILNLTVIDWNFDRTKIAGLSQDVYNLALLNDSAAIQIFNDASYELSRIIIAIKNKLDFKGSVNASYQGGVFKSERFIINPLIDRLKAHNINLVSPFAGPDVGSVILAFKYSNTPITQSVLDNLKQI